MPVPGNPALLGRSGEELTEQLAQTGADLGVHTRKFDAHAFAGVRVSNRRPGAHLSAGNFEDELNNLSRCSRFRGFYEKAAKPQGADAREAAVTCTLPSHDHSFR